jgi:hypothetical protein
MKKNDWRASPLPPAPSSFLSLTVYKRRRADTLRSVKAVAPVGTHQVYTGAAFET